jgi:hypothetical protein
MRDVCGPIAGLMMTLATLGLLAGCEGSPPAVDTSNTEATVKGVVKVGGAPVTEGDIIFDPANYKRKDAQSRTAKIGPDGTYTIKTLTGENQVSLGGSLAKKKPILQRVHRSVDVHEGENTFDFESNEK